MDRTDAFELALGALRARLRDGDFAPGARIPASRLAEALRLSATPVREALCRLAGEGLVEERRQQGFFVRTLTGVDVADLYRLSLAYLATAHGRRTGHAPIAPAPTPPATADPVRELEDLFMSWIAAAAGQSLLGLYQTLAVQLGPVRRVEPLVLGDLAAEAAAVRALQDGESTAQRMAALRRFHARRIAQADRLASLVNRPNLRSNL